MSVGTGKIYHCALCVDLRVVRGTGRCPVSISDKRCEKGDFQGNGTGKELAVECQEELCRNAIQRLSIKRETGKIFSGWAQEERQERYAMFESRKSHSKDM
jgi:hypothetical protein